MNFRNSSRLNNEIVPEATGIISFHRKERRTEMKKMMTAVMVAVLMAAGSVQAVENVPTEKSFDQTDGVLARARAIEDIEYKIMVQRATQAAILRK